MLGVAVSWGATVATAAADDASALFDPDTVYVVHLTLPQASIEELEDESEEYVQGQFSIAATGGTPARKGRRRLRSKSK